MLEYLQQLSALPIEASEFFHLLYSFISYQTCRPLNSFNMTVIGKRILIIAAALATITWAQDIAGHGVLVQPLPGAQVAQTGAGGKNITTSVQPGKAGTNAQSEVPKTINFGGVPLQIEGEGITLNGQPVGEEASGGSQNGQLEVAGSDVVVNGRPLDGKPDPGLTITEGTANTGSNGGNRGGSSNGITVIGRRGEVARNGEVATAGASNSASSITRRGERRIRVNKRW